MTNLSNLLWGSVLLIAPVLSVFSQCETCEPDLTCVAVDFPVLCPEQLPNAVQGEPYSSTATFNLPPLWWILVQDWRPRC